VLAKAPTQIGASVGGAPTSISYFDFAYPGANRISVINAPNNNDYFDVHIPNGFQVFEAAETRAYLTVGNVTSSIRTGQSQTWNGALIIVYKQP
jgi:hypothetical protein